MAEDFLLSSFPCPHTSAEKANKRAATKASVFIEDLIDR
jgi:hypothetical protein